MSSTLNVIRIICRFVDNNTHKYLDHDVVYSSCVKLSNCKVISTIDDQGLNSDPMIIRLPKYIIHNWERVVRMTSCKTRELELTMKEDNIVVVICIKTQSKDFSTLMMPCLLVGR